jgi:hypothetical protein
MLLIESSGKPGCLKVFSKDVMKNQYKRRDFSELGKIHSWRQNGG